METLYVWKDFWHSFHGSRLSYGLIAAMVIGLILLVWAAIYMLSIDPLFSALIVVVIILLAFPAVFILDTAMYEHQ